MGYVDLAVKLRTVVIQKFERDMSPIEEGCGCPVCRKYSRAYIRHLLKAKEMLGMRLCVLHNLRFYNRLMEEIRRAIAEDRFLDFRRAFYERYDMSRNF